MRLRSTELRRAISGLVFKALSSPLEKACRVLVVMVAAPALGATVFGAFQFASTVAAMMAAVMAFGLGTWTTRALAREADRGSDRALAVLDAGFRLRVLAAAPYLAALGVVALASDAGEPRRAMLVFGFAALASSFVDYFGAVLRGREEFRREATMNATRAAVTTAGALGALCLDRSLMSLAHGVLAGALASAAIGYAHVRGLRRGTKTDARAELARDFTRRALREAVPLWLAGVLATLYFRSDILIVRYYGGEAEVGAYTAAYRIFEGAMILPAGVMSVAFPRLVRARGSSGRVSSVELQLTALLLSLGLVIAAGLWLADDAIVRLLLGATFARSGAALRVLALAVPVMFVSYAVTEFVVARGRERPLVGVLAAMLGLNVGLNLATVPRLGGTGAAWSTLLTEIALIAACGALLARRREPSPAGSADAVL